MFKTFITACLLFSGEFALAETEAQWDFLYEEDGIKVYRQDADLPTFKAEGRLQAHRKMTLPFHPE